MVARRSEGIVRELRQRCADQSRDLPEGLRGFLDRYGGSQLPYRRRATDNRSRAAVLIG
jgi:hypothetical protein